MTVTIAKWGNSVGVRIPSLVLKTAGFAVGDRVQTQVQPDRSILIRAVTPSRTKINIMAMIDKITPETLPDFSELNDQPVGKEIW
jgi:antitoxin component of MazEF toxin-antitoxin module